MRNKSKIIKKLASIALALVLAAQPLATLPMNVFAGTGSNSLPTAPTKTKVESFEILNAQETVNVGDEFTLTAGNFMPSDAHEDYKKVEWEVTSDDIDADSISVTKADTTATISVAEPGTVTIIATAKNGLGENKSNEWIKASVNITVLQPVTSITGFEGLPAGNTIVGKTCTLTATLAPPNVSDTYKTVTWSSDTPAVATVDKDTGTVTALAPGTAKITATAKNGSTNQDDWKSASVIITFGAFTPNRGAKIFLKFPGASQSNPVYFTGLCSTQTTKEEVEYSHTTLGSHDILNFNGIQIFSDRWDKVPKCMYISGGCGSESNPYVLAWWK